MTRLLSILAILLLAITGCSAASTNSLGTGATVGARHTDPKPKNPHLESKPLTSVSALNCFAGDANRVQVIYAVAADKVDRYSSVLASIKSYVATMDAVFNNSAAKVGGTRHIRFVQDANCEPIIDHVVIGAGTDVAFGSIRDAVTTASPEYQRTDRHELVFVDSSYGCGTANIIGSSAPTNNPNSTSGNLGVVGTQCWSYHTPAHELTHTLGGVQNDAPHSTGGYHCYDGHDVECYNDGGPSGSLYSYASCPNSADEWLLDCRNDDFFLAATPAAGTYLSTHWNVADSPYLEGTNGTGTPTPTPTTTSPTPTVSPSPTIKPCGKSHRPGCK